MANIQKNFVKRLFFLSFGCFLTSLFCLLPTSAEHIFELSASTQLQMDGNGNNVPLEIETDTILRDTLKAPISVVFPSPILDSFLYDTSKDTAINFWRTDATKSWYTENKDDSNDGICDFALGDGDGDPRGGTDNRCGTGKFPEKALLIATENDFYIFDVGNQSLWMKFEKNVGGSVVWHTMENASVFGINGNIFLGFSSHANQNGALQRMNFLTDEIVGYRTANAPIMFSGRKIDNIAQRNTAHSVWLQNLLPGQFIIDNRVKDIFGRDIGGKTYLAVGTESGVSVLNILDGSVVNQSNIANTTQNKVSKVYISENAELYVKGGENISQGATYIFSPLSTLANKRTDWNAYGYTPATTFTKSIISNSHQFFPLANGFFAIADKAYDARNGGFYLLNPVQKLLKSVTKDFATLPLFGDKVKGHWVNDLVDKSGSGNILTNVGNVQISSVATNATTKAFIFDGTNYLESNSADFNITGNLTVGAWVKTDTHTHYPRFIEKNTSSAGNGFVLHSQPSGNFTVRIDTIAQSNQLFSSSSNISDNNWHFISFLKDGNNVKIFVDGKNENIQNINGTLDLSSGSFRIGSILGGNNTFNGSIALPFVSAEAYTDEQIKKMYDDSKNWFAENAKTTLQGTSNDVVDISCVPHPSPLPQGEGAGGKCFVATQDSVMTEIDLETGLTSKYSDAARFSISNNVGVVAHGLGSLLSFVVPSFSSELLPIGPNALFTISLPAGISVQGIDEDAGISGIQIKTDAAGKLKFSLISEKILEDDSKEISLQSVSYADIQKKFAVNRWVFGSAGQILAIKNYGVISETKKLLDATPEFVLRLTGKNDDLSKSVKFRLQLSNDTNFSSIAYEKFSDNFLTLASNGSVETEFSIPEESKLKEGNFFARVQSEDEKGRRSAWSPAFLFSLEKDYIPSAPSGLYMKEVETEKEIPTGTTISKNAIRLFFKIVDPNANQKVGYVLQIAHDDNFLDIFQEAIEAPKNEQGNFIFPLSGMIPDQKYYWRVRGVDESGNLGEWSAQFLVKVKIPSANAFFVQGKDFENFPTLPQKRFFSPATLSDKFLSFGFTLPALEPIPSFMPFVATGKAKIFASDNFNCSGPSCVLSDASLKNISALSAVISEKKMTGTIRIDGGGYIYTSLSAMPESLRSVFAVDFAGVQNDARGTLFGKAWSSKYGMINFGASRPKTNCVQPKTFDKNNFGVCIDDVGFFQGFAKIEHPMFLESELLKIFSNTQWQSVQSFFVNGVETGQKIFHPSVTKSALENISDAQIKTKLLQLFEQEGGYIQFSHSDFVGKDAFQTKWRRDGVQVPIEVKSGKSEYAESTILINTIPVKSTKKNFVISQLDGNTWELKMAQEFDTSTEAGATEMKNFLISIPENGVVVIGSYENPTQGRSIFVEELLGFGASTEKINALTPTSAFVFVGRKGKETALVEQISEGKIRYLQEAEKISASGNSNANLLLGSSISQSLGQIIFSPSGGGAELSPSPQNPNTPRTGGIVGKMWTEGAGFLFMDSDGNFGSSNSGNDYGMVIAKEDAEKNLYFSGKLWGSAIGFVEVSRGAGMTTCEKIIDPNPDHFGVCRDKNGAFHGFAWSPSFGWISFENIYSHDPNSSLGFLFEISKDPSFTTGVTKYQVDKISAGDVLLSSREIFESLGKKCLEANGVYNEECSFPYGSYYWRVQTIGNGVSSYFGDIQSVNIEASNPLLTHSCSTGETLPMNPEFLFTIAEKNLPELAVQYSIHFIDTSANPVIIPSIYSGEFSKEYLKENTEIAHLSRANGKKISYTIEAINKERKTTKITCGGTIPYLVRGLEVESISPKDYIQTSRSPNFKFEVSTLENDEYDFFIEVKEKGAENTAFETWTKVGEKTGKKTDADMKNMHDEKLANNLPANKNLCWQVRIVSKDGTEAKSTVECFFPKNEKPEIESVIMKGDGSVVGTSDESHPGTTSDRTPEFEVKVKDDSGSGKMILKVFDISSGTPVLWETFEQPATLVEGKATVTVQIPNEKQLPTDTKNYHFEVVFEDNETEKSDTKKGWFVFSMQSDKIGLGNIGTDAILMNASVGLPNPPHGLKTDHRFGISAATGGIDFNPLGGGVYIAPSKVYGYAWNENLGWIRFNCSANPQTKEVFEYKTPMPGTVLMHTLVDAEDDFCKTDGKMESKYGVVPGIVGGKPSDISVDNQDLLGKAKIEALQENGQQGFLYFDVETFAKDFPAETTVINEWKNGEFGTEGNKISYKNIHGRAAVGIDKNGKLSGFAWSPSYGWIDMGISQGNADFNTPESKKYFPITEYQPAAATCIPKLNIPLKNTFEAAELLNLNLAESCEGTKLTGSTLYLKENGKTEKITFSGACQNVENCSLLVDKTLEDGTHTTKTAERIFEIWGEIVQDNGQKLIIEETQPIQYKIIANSKPDFSSNGYAKVAIFNTSVLANFLDTARLEIVLKDKFGNEIFETNDIDGKKAREMDFSVLFNNTIRTEQFASGEWTRGTAVDFAESTPLEESTPAFTTKKFVAENFETANSAISSVKMKSYSPTSENDILEWKSFSLKIVSLLNEKTEEKFNEIFEQNADTKKITLGEKEENTQISFKPIFSGESRFEKAFDETSAEAVPYTIKLLQTKGTNPVLEDGNNGIGNFHFLHCMESIPENLLSFYPIASALGGNEGQNCFEISKGTAQSQFRNSGEPRYGKVNENNVDIVEAKNMMTSVPKENGVLYNFSAQATRTDFDNPERITAKLYVAFERIADGKSTWIKYPIENLDSSGAQFLADEGFVEGSTSGDKIYAETVSNRDEGNFFSSAGSYSIEEIRNALYKSIIQFKNEKDIETATEGEEITIPSDTLSAWLSKDDAESLESENDNFNMLYNGDVLWIEFDAVAAGNTVILGNDDKNIDDFGGNAAGKNGSKTIVVLGGNVKIDENIFRRYNGTLGIIVLRKNEHLRSSDQNILANSGNILISPYVTNIRSLLYADGSIFSYNPYAEDDSLPPVYDGFTTREKRNEDLSSQLYFLGSIVAQNTYGGSFAPGTMSESNYINALQNRPVWHSSTVANLYSDSEKRKAESIRFDLKRLRDFRRITKYKDDANGNGVKDSVEDESTGECTAPIFANCTPTETYFVAADGHFPAYENFIDIEILNDENRGWDEENSGGKKARSAVVFEYDEQIQKNPPPGTVVFETFQIKQ